MSISKEKVKVNVAPTFGLCQQEQKKIFTLIIFILTPAKSYVISHQRPPFPLPYTTTLKLPFTLFFAHHVYIYICLFWNITLHAHPS